MRTLFVISTKDIPVGHFDRLVSTELEDIIVQKIMTKDEEGEDNDIVTYLQNYKHAVIDKEVKEQLRNEEHLPIIKRVVGDYHIYVTLCISSDMAPKGGKSGHDFIAKLIDLAKNDMQFDGKEDRIYVLAHDKDLCKEGNPADNNRFLPANEFKGELAQLEDIKVYVYQHKSGVEVYNSLILSLRAGDDVLLKKCKRISMFLEY